MVENPSAGDLPRIPTAWQYAIDNTGWMYMSDGWHFLFGGSMRLARALSEAGLLDRDGLTNQGVAYRRETDKNAHLEPRIERPAHQKGGDA